MRSQPNLAVRNHLMSRSSLIPVKVWSALDLVHDQFSLAAWVGCRWGRVYRQQCTPVHRRASRVKVQAFLARSRSRLPAVSITSIADVELVDTPKAESVSVSPVNTSSFASLRVTAAPTAGTVKQAGSTPMPAGDVTLTQDQRQS
jgi:hypothetical protein